MACYHCSVKCLSHSQGRSSVQFSAYMSGEKERDESLNRTFDHTTKEEVRLNEMIFAERVKDEWREKERFWNEVERIEDKANSRVARTWEIALPNELSREGQERIVKDFAKELIEKDHMPAVQYAIHEKEGNVHAHIMAPTRDIDERGEWMQKEKKVYKLDREGERIPVLDADGNQKRDAHNRLQWERERVQAQRWNARDLVHEWRERAATLQNRELEREHQLDRVSHLSLKEQGIDREPTIHEGYKARQMGLESERVQMNREIKERNVQRETIKQHLEQTIEKAKEILTHARESISRYINELCRDDIRRTLDIAKNREGEQRELERKLDEVFGRKFTPTEEVSKSLDNARESAEKLRELGEQVRRNNEELQRICELTHFNIERERELERDKSIKFRDEQAKDRLEREERSIKTSERLNIKLTREQEQTREELKREEQSIERSYHFSR